MGLALTYLANLCANLALGAVLVVLLGAIICDSKIKIIKIKILINRKNYIFNINPF